MKTTVLRGLLVSLVSLPLALAGCGSSNQPAASTPTTVNFAVDSTDLGMLPYVATKEGYFARQNVSPVIRTFTYGVDGLDALLTGQENVSFVCDFGALVRAPSGHFKIVAITSTGLGPFSKLVVRSGINSGQDLSGKTMGIPLGTATQFTTLKYLESVNVPQSSVKFVNFSAAFDMVTAMRAGRIDAAFLWGPAIAQGLAIPGTKVLIGDDQIPGAATICLMAVDTTFLSQHQAAVKGAMAALVAASKFIKANPDQAAQILANGVGATVSDIKGYMQADAYPVEFTQVEFQHLMDLEKFQEQQGILKQPVDVSKLVDLDILKSVAPANVTAH